MIQDWDEYFMSLCFLVAMRSKDESSNFGAVIIGEDKQILSTGYNSFIRNVDDNVKERQLRPEKYLWFEHAERNAIYNAARSGIRLKDSIMYINGFPCSDCARAIIQSGIKEIVMDLYSSIYQDYTFGDSWKNQKQNTLQMLYETKINTRYYIGKIVREIQTKIRGVNLEEWR